MPEWLSYTLSDFMMFSRDTYFRLFELQNRAVWPWQLAVLAVAAALPWLALRGGLSAGRLIAATLAGLWLVCAWSFHLGYYASINLAAPLFAGCFGLQALLLVWVGAVRGRVVANRQTPVRKAVGLGLLLFALVGYPLLAPLAGQPLTQAQVFAIAPDPTVAATLGVLLIVVRPPWPLFVLPVLWAAVSGATLWAMDSPQAPLLPGIAIASVTLAATARPARGARPADESTS